MALALTHDKSFETAMNAHALTQDIVAGAGPLATHASRMSGTETLPFLLVSAALDDLETGLVIFDCRLQVLHVTSQIPELLGLLPDEPLEGLCLRELLAKSTLDQKSLETIKNRLEDLNPDGFASAIHLRNREGSRHLRVRLHTVGEGYLVASFKTVPGDDANKSRTADFASRDSLTGLASRHAFEHRLKEVLAIEPQERATVFLIDLDRFKAVNDTLGHPAGDSLLRLAAERLSAAVRKQDLVARLGGDEFAVLLYPASTTIEESTIVAKRILDLVQRTYLIEGQLVNIGVSIGIAQSPGDGDECARLMRSADLALYHSKASGRSTYSYFEQHMERRAQARRTSELELRRALALRQLELFYQPQVDTITNRLVGFEALLRWRHPERGMIPPGDFLPIAEEIGVIVPIGDWVLRTACREAMTWPDDITVAVNASPLQFDAGNFAESVQRALAASGLPGERLEVEITEGIMLRNDDTVLRTLHDLRAMKVRIAMDDFGTGYASLSQLARFPFDKIKIDRSLAGFDGDNPKRRSIVRAITALGQSLGVTTLAEGVEDANQLARLQNDGCTSVQGYLFGKPVPTSQLKEVFSRFV